MSKQFGIYAGIVIQNNDPDKVGRVKIFIPGINASLYEHWTEDVMDKVFSGIVDDILPILEPLRNDLPWAECATGLFSGNTSEMSIADEPEPLERPSDELVLAPPMDTFGFENYTPGDYSGTSSGTYVIPNIGAHMYVFFKCGNVNYPVYFASTHSAEHWENIYKDDYPTAYELDGSGDYLNKQVLNSNKHTLEFIDSDDLEEIRLSHFSGSNIRILNEFNSRYAVEDDFVLVENEKYTNVRKNRNAIIEVDENIEIFNDRNTYIKHNEDIEIGNDEIKRIIVDLLETIGGSVTRTVGGDVTLTIGGSLTIVAGASVTITAGGAITTEAGGINTVKGSEVHLNP